MFNSPVDHRARGVARAHLHQRTATDMKPRQMRVFRSLLAVMIIAGIGAAPFASRSPGRDAKAPSVLFPQSATSGSLKPSGAGEMTLTLRGVPPQVVWFQDRPHRHAGHLRAAGLTSGWRSFGFEGDPPNAALTLLGAADGADTVVVELLRRPRYDLARGTMTYTVRLLSQAPDGLEDLAGDVDASVPATFGVASLFIDAAQIDRVGRREAFMAAADTGRVQMRHYREFDW